MKKVSRLAGFLYQMISTVVRELRGRYVEYKGGLERIGMESNGVRIGRIIQQTWFDRSL